MIERALRIANILADLASPEQRSADLSELRQTGRPLALERESYRSRASKIVPRFPNPDRLTDRERSRIAETLLAHNERIRELHQEGQGDVAHTYAEHVLETARQFLGETSPLFLISLFNFATVKERLGDRASAEELFREGLRIAERTQSHEDLATLHNGLGMCLHAQGKYQEAVTNYKAASDANRRVKGSLPVDFAINLARGYLAIGYIGSARDIFQMIYELRKDSPNQNSELLASAAHDFGRALLELGRVSESESLLREALEEYQKTPQQSVTEYVICLNDLLRLTESFMSPEKAKPLKKSFQKEMRKFPHQHPAFIPLLLAQAQSDLDADRLVDARRRLAEAARYCRSHDLTAHPHYADLRYLYARLYFRRACYGSCLRAASHAVKIFDQSGLDSTGRRNQALALVARTELNADRYEAAASSMQEALENTVQSMGSDSPQAAEILVDVGVLQIRQGQYSKAKETLSIAFVIQKSTHDDSHPSLGITIHMIGLACFQLGQGEDASRHFADAAQRLGSAYGKRHFLATIASLHHAVAAASLGQLTKAERLLVDVGERLETADNVVASSEWLVAKAIIGNERDEHETALMNMRRAIAILERSAPEESVHVAALRHNEAVIMAALGKSHEALLVAEAAVDVLSRRLPSDHPDRLLAEENFRRIREPHQSSEHSKSLAMIVLFAA